MSAFKGAPGPWNVNDESSDLTVDGYAAKGHSITGPGIVIGWLNPAFGNISVANAVLMEQAPAMLAVLLQLEANDLHGSDGVAPILAALREGGAL